MLVWILPQVVQTIKPQTIKPTGNGYLSSSKNKAWKKIKARTGFDPMTFTISMQRSINWVKIRPERWRFHIHFFIRSSHDFYIFTVLTIIATTITTTSTYFPLHVDSTSWRFVLNLMLMALLTGVYLSGDFI